MGLVLAVIVIALGYGFMSESTSAAIGSNDLVDEYTESGMLMEKDHDTRHDTLPSEVLKWEEKV